MKKQLIEQIRDAKESKETEMRIKTRNRSNKWITETEFEYWRKMIRKKVESQFCDYNRIKNRIGHKRLDDFTRNERRKN